MSGVVLNVITIVIGTAVGLLLGRAIAERFRTIAFTAIGLSTLLIGVSMVVSGLGKMGQSEMGDYSALVYIGALLSGALVGEALRIEYWLERFGEWLQSMARNLPFLEPSGATDGESEKSHTLVEGFVTASLLFCVGAMTVLGSIQDGLGDHQLLYLKSTLDGFASLFLASTLGVGVGLSIIPVIVIQGGLALGAGALQPYMTDAVIASMSAVGGSLILGIGLDMIGVKRLPVGNMLPAIVIAAVAAAILG